jgi:hypothetical protein
MGESEVPRRGIRSRREFKVCFVYFQKIHIYLFSALMNYFDSTLTRLFKIHFYFLQISMFFFFTCSPFFKASQQQGLQDVAPGSPFPSTSGVEAGMYLIWFPEDPIFGGKDGREYREVGGCGGGKGRRREKGEGREVGWEEGQRLYFAHDGLGWEEGEERWGRTKDKQEVS